MTFAALKWLDATLLGLAREFRWSYAPPLMVYLAAGISGLTAIVGTFFIKDHLGLSASFLAALGFWAGIPWVLKMPLGHLVDLIWRWKAVLVYVGASLIATSIAIMYGLIAHPGAMRAWMSAEAWYVLSALLAPVGYVVQDVVADAMTVEAVPVVGADGRRLGEDETKAMHTTMQTLGRVAIIGGGLAVALLNIVMFSGVEAMSAAEKTAIYARIHLYALAIPAVSVLGTLLGQISARARRRAARASGDAAAIAEVEPPRTEPNWAIFAGSLAFVALTLGLGLTEIPFAQEIIFAGSMAIVLILMRGLLRALSPAQRGALVGTAVIVFAFRAVPLPGQGSIWWQIDVLGFDEQFLSVLTLISSLLALVGMLALRRYMARTSMARLVAILSLVGGVMWLPSIALYNGIHEWTAPLTGGVVDARFIAILDTAIESPLAQVAMIPMLAWIAKNAPAELKATFFAVMASFTNLALSASGLGTKYLNQVLVVTREVRDAATGAVTVAADYSQLGWLFIACAVLTVAAPLLAIALVQASRLHTEE